MAMTSLFHKTDAGYEACRRARSTLPQDYVGVLDAVHYATRFAAIAARLPHCPEAKIVGYLEDLEAIGLIESVSLDWLRAVYALEHQGA
jgi:predicted transcriptional regulator